MEGFKTLFEDVLKFKTDKNVFKAKQQQQCSKLLNIEMQLVVVLLNMMIIKIQLFRKSFTIQAHCQAHHTAVHLKH